MFMAQLYEVFATQKILVSRIILLLVLVFSQALLTLRKISNVVGLIL